MNTSPSRKTSLMLKTTNLMSRKHCQRETSIGKPISNSKGTEVPKQFFGMTAQHKESDGPIGNAGDGECRESSDQEGSVEYIAKFTSTWLGSSQGRQKHPEVQWKDSWLQPYIH